MNEEIEYAEMLEIPVSTVNIVRKNQRRKKVKSSESAEAAFAPALELPAPPLKDSVIAQVNDRLSEPTLDTNQDPFSEDVCLENSVEDSSDPPLMMDSIPERIDTTRLYSSEETSNWRDTFYPQSYPIHVLSGTLSQYFACTTFFF